MRRDARLLFVFRLAIFLVADFTVAATAFAQAPSNWRLLIAAPVERNATKTRIALASNEARTLGIRLRAVTGTLVVRRVVLNYSNGQQHIEDKPVTLSSQQGPPIDEREPRMGSVIVDAIELEHAAPTGSQQIEVWGLVASKGDGTRSARKPEPETDYKEVEVLFGTSRLPEAPRIKNGRALATFGARDGGKLTRGRALVTIPKQGRAPGEIPRPTLDLVLFKFDLRREDPRRDFTIAAVDVLPLDAFASKVTAMAGAAKTFSGQAFIFTHGYNTNFDDALLRAAQITHDIGFDGAPIVFSWQSRGGTLDYSHDQAAVGDARAHLAALLREVSELQNVRRVHIIAHSMGSDVVIRALQHLKLDTTKPPPRKIGEIVLAAPDVDRKSFERDAPLLRSLADGGITLFASSADKALKYSAWKAGGRPRAGGVPSGEGPLILAGFDTIDISQGSTEFFALHHTEFAERQHLLKDIFDILRGPSRPPHVRAERFYTPIGAAPKMYWLFQRN